MQKKLLWGVAGFVTLLFLGLLLTSKVSDAYTTAASKILSDPAIAEEYGTQQYVMLVGASYKLQPYGSCARLLFAVKGNTRIGIVEVLLRRKNMHSDPWEVLGVTSGYYSESKVSCTAGR